MTDDKQERRAWSHEEAFLMRYELQEFEKTFKRILDKLLRRSAGAISDVNQDSIDMMRALDDLRECAESMFGAQEIIGFEANKDEAQAAVIFDAGELRYRLRLEELR